MADGHTHETDIEVSAQDIFLALQDRFPLEFEICVQQAQINKAKRMLAEARGAVHAGTDSEKDEA